GANHHAHLYRLRDQSDEWVSVDQHRQHVLHDSPGHKRRNCTAVVAVCQHAKRGPGQFLVCVERMEWWTYAVLQLWNEFDESDVLERVGFLAAFPGRGNVELKVLLFAVSQRGPIAAGTLRRLILQFRPRAAAALLLALVGFLSYRPGSGTV